MTYCAYQWDDPPATNDQMHLVTVRHVCILPAGHGGDSHRCHCMAAASRGE